MAVIITKECLMNQAYRIQEDEIEFYLRLFKNDVTPDIDTEIGDLTEADFQGYAEVEGSIASVTWDALEECSIAAFDAHTWTKGAGGTSNTIYGWYVVEANRDGGSGKKLFLICRFGAPVLMESTGSIISIEPKALFFPRAGA